jgi:hypothetical protein
LIYNRILIFFSVLFITNLCVAQNNNAIFQDYRSKSSEEIVVAIRNDLTSKNSSRRDRAVTFLSILINAGKKSQKEHETVTRLASNKKVIYIASDIVAERLAGWYEERECGQDRSMPMYYPLIHPLSISRHKTAIITLAMAQPMVGFDTFYSKSICSNEQVLKIVLSKLKTIDNKLCCFYPGKDPVADMLAIDFRLNMLRMYLEAAKGKGSGFRSNDAKMKKFISGCLNFGGGKKGRIIRTRAVEIACILIKAGEKDFLPVVKRIATSDPFYLYKAETAKSNSLPQYDITSKYYPVREKARKELSLQK